MKLIILAAGYATRLSPLTDNCAKPLLKLANKYMIDHVLEKIACKEISEIHVITNKRFYKDFAIWAENKQNHFQRRQIFVWNDQTDTNENRLGAIGDIQFVIEHSNCNSDIVVVAGDNLFIENQCDFIANDNHDILVGGYDLKSLSDMHKYSSIVLSDSNQILQFEEKPKNPQSTLAAIALYKYKKNILPFIKQYLDENNNPDQPGRLVQWLCQQHCVFAQNITGKWFDIGDLEMFESAEQYLIVNATSQSIHH